MTGPRRIFAGFFRAQVVVVCATLVCVHQVAAVELETEFRAGVAQSDNIARSSVNELDEFISTAGVMFNLTHESRAISANLQSDFDYFNYRDDTFDEETRGAAALNLEYRIIDETLSWTLLNNYGQEIIDPLSAPNPGNRENVNFLTTGPHLSFQLGARHGVGADATYSTVDYESRPIDNDRTTIGVWFARQMNERSRLSLNVSQNNIAFDTTQSTTDYDVIESYIRYASATSRNSISVDLGHTAIDVPGVGGSGQLMRMDWTRTLSPYSTFAVTAGSRFSDNGDIFRFLQLNNPRSSTTAADAPAGSQPFRFNYGILNYNFEPNRTSIGVSISYSGQSFESIIDEDRKITTASLSVGREFSSRSYGNFNVRFNRRDFETISRKDDDILASATFGFSINGNLNIELEQRFSKRNSSELLRDFEENRTTLRFTYRPSWSR